jgi:hypothetical protein
MIANAKRANASDEYVAVTSIPIADQITRELLPTTGRRQLVGYPFRRWVCGNAEPEDLSPAVAHDQQSIKQPERDGRNDKQVHRRDPICVVSEECLPALQRWTTPAHHILCNAGLPDIDPEFEQFKWIRGAPHNGLAMLISRINCRISVGTVGRPRRRLDFQHQNNRKPARCHRTTVSGRTMASASRAFGNRWQTQPRINLSTAKNGIRPGLPRRNTMICCLSSRTSPSSAARDRNRSTTKPKISLQRSDIQRRIVRFSADCQLDQIYDRDRT